LPRLAEAYATLDPRSLGVGRIGLGALLLYDLVRRVPGLPIWYSNEGLLPNHTVLWRPSADYVFSFLLAASRPEEAAFMFVVFGLVYLAFTLGWHTRFFHVLSFVCLVSVHDRVIFLENGGDVALNLLCAWTLFLPMGARFSLDALQKSLRARRERNAHELNDREEFRARETRPAVSLAVLAILLELSVIYYFNAVNKHGWTWRRGMAVQYVLYQERMVTWFGLLMRELMTPRLSRILSYAVLAIEYGAPLLLLLPIGRVQLRRAAMILYPALHLAFASSLNLGQFSFNMIGYFPLLLSAEDWDALGRRFGPGAERARTVFVREESALGSGWARLLSRLDSFSRLRFKPADVSETGHPIWAVDDPVTGHRWTGAAALAECLAALPGGLPFALLLRPRWIRGVCDRVGAWVATHQEWVAGGLMLESLSSQCETVEPVSSPARTWFRRRAGEARELAAGILLLAVTSQLLVENHAIPQKFKLPQPKWITQLVVYPRLLQGWQMFSADVPTGERVLYVDAVTFGGRHVDPFNEAGSRVAGLPVERIPGHMEQDEFWCDYTNRIPENEAYWRAFKEWVFNYHRRTGRTEDRIISFEARLIEADEPAPGEVGQKNLRTKVIMRERE